MQSQSQKVIVFYVNTVEVYIFHALKNVEAASPPQLAVVGKQNSFKDVYLG